MTEGRQENSENNFATERTKLWRTTQLKPSFQSTIEHIEKFGCDVLHVAADDYSLGFSYTTGVYETTGQPELIQVGLKYKTAQFALDEAAERSRVGLLKVDHREANIIGNVDCIFRPVEECWIQRLMYRAQWFYEEQPFPVLQCIYPDFENRFPWEQGFEETWRGRQALLFAGVEWTDAETNLWTANDRATKSSIWKWPDPPHTMVFVRAAVAKNSEPVVDVYHDKEDGAWQFHGKTLEGEPSLICLHHVVDNDASLNEIADLPLGWRAWRDSIDTPWVREPHTPTFDEDS